MVRDEERDRADAAETHQWRADRGIAQDDLAAAEQRLRDAQQAGDNSAVRQAREDLEDIKQALYLTTISIALVNQASQEQKGSTDQPQAVVAPTPTRVCR